MTYSLDYRKQVLKSLDEGITFAEAAIFYDISPTTIQKWKERIHSKTTRYIKPYKIENEALAQDVKDYPDDYHYERAQRFNCSPTGISEALKRIGVSKKKTLEHPKTCPVKRAHYLKKLNHVLSQCFAIVYMDESETIRRYGYAPISSPSVDRYNWQAKDRTNVISALYGKMLFALDYLKTNINKEVFYSWCEFILIPKLKRKCVIVMDNAAFHTNRRIQKLLNRHGHRILWLPPYSPDLNPIEKKWAQVKFLRQG